MEKKPSSKCKHVCECGETKMYFGKNKLCPVCDEYDIKVYCRETLRREKKVIERIIKVRR